MATSALSHQQALSSLPPTSFSLQVRAQLLLRAQSSSAAPLESHSPTPTISQKVCSPLKQNYSRASCLTAPSQVLVPAPHGEQLLPRPSWPRWSCCPAHLMGPRVSLSLPGRMAAPSAILLLHSSLPISSTADSSRGAPGIQLGTPFSPPVTSLRVISSSHMAQDAIAVLAPSSASSPNCPNFCCRHPRPPSQTQTPSTAPSSFFPILVNCTNTPQVSQPHVLFPCPPYPVILLVTSCPALICPHCHNRPGHAQTMSMSLCFILAPPQPGLHKPSTQSLKHKTMPLPHT